MTTPERRRHPRFPFHSSGILELAGARHDGTLIDISLSGALIRLAQPFAITDWEPCRLELLNGRNDGCWIDAVRIACQRGELFGLEFAELSSNVRRFLDAIVEMNLGVSDLLNRELPAMLAQTERQYGG